MFSSTRAVQCLPTLRILNRSENTIAAQTTSFDISLLEVERGLGKAIFVRDIMNCVYDIEDIGACSARVRAVTG